MLSAGRSERFHIRLSAVRAQSMYDLPPHILTFLLHYVAMDLGAGYLLPKPYPLFFPIWVFLGRAAVGCWVRGVQRRTHLPHTGISLQFLSAERLGWVMCA